MKKNAFDENLTLVQNSLEYWLSFRKFMLKSFTDVELLTEDEANYLEVKSCIARNLRAMGERLKEIGNFDFGEKTMRELLTKCVSVTHLRALPVSDKRALQKEWHGVFIRLSRTVGALKFMSEGYVPSVAGKGGKKRPSGGGGSSKGMIIAIVVVVGLLVVVGGVVALFALGLVG